MRGEDSSARDRMPRPWSPRKPRWTRVRGKDSLSIHVGGSSVRRGSRDGDRPGTEPVGAVIDLATAPRGLAGRSLAPEASQRRVHEVEAGEHDRGQDQAGGGERGRAGSEPGDLEAGTGQA